MFFVVSLHPACVHAFRGKPLHPACVRAFRVFRGKPLHLACVHAFPLTRFLKKSLYLYKKNMSKLSHLVLSFILLAHFAQAQSFFLDETQLPRFQSELVLPTNTKPSNTVHSRSDFDAALADSFQLALETLLSDLDSKGLSAAIIADNGDEWTGAAGISHQGTDMTTDMYLGMGSISKSVTSACVLKLEEEGLLSIEDSIGTYLPSFPNVLGSTTIKQLLNHTSGIYDFLEHPSILDSMKEDFSRVWQPEEVLNDFVNAPYFAPNTGWHYSNSNYLLAGLIIEKVTALPYDEVVRQKILTPTGLDDLFLNPYESPTGNIAHVWFNYPGLGKFDLDALGSTPISIYSSAWAAGAYFSRPILASKWMKSLLDGNVLSPSSMDKMKTFVSTGNGEYGLGLMNISNGTQQFIGHQGYIIYSSLCFYDPITKLTIAIQSNDGSSTDLSPFLLKGYELYLSSLVANKNIPTTVSKAFPNPANQIVQLELPKGIAGKLNIIASDMLGHRLAAKIVDQDAESVKLDINHWPKGQYFIRLETAERRVVYLVSHL